jgi:hypothetical protein
VFGVRRRCCHELLSAAQCLLLLAGMLANLAPCRPDPGICPKPSGCSSSSRPAPTSRARRAFSVSPARCSTRSRSATATAPLQLALSRVREHGADLDGAAPAAPRWRWPGVWY